MAAVVGSKVDQGTCWKLASFGELDGLKALIESGVNVTEQDDRGFTPLNWAARNGHLNVVSFLIENGCSLEVPSFGGLRPLHHSCNKNAEKIVKTLIKASAGMFTQYIMMMLSNYCITSNILPLLLFFQSIIKQ